MRDIRVLNMTAGQKIEDDEVMKRIGELSYRNLGALAKMSLYDTSNAKALVVGDGLRVSPSSGMIIKVTAGECLQTILSGTSGGAGVPVIQTTDQFVELDAADGTIRTDIIEAQIISTDAKTDTVQVATVITGTSGSGGSSVIVTNDTIYRDVRYSLSVQSQKNTITPTAATAGQLIGTVDLSSPIDLSSRYLINMADGEDGSFQEVDCRGSDPANTTRAEIMAALNGATARTFAEASGNYIKLTGQDVGETSIFKFKPPVTDSGKDALQLIMGLSIGGTYIYEYQGINEWFKLAEIDIGAATTTITETMIRDIGQSGSWTTQGDTVLYMPDHVYDALEKANIGQIANCDDSSIGWSIWKKFKKMIDYSIDAGTVFSGSYNHVSTYSLVYTASAAYYGGVLASNGDIHFIPYSTIVGQKISSAGVVSTYSLVYTTSGGAYVGGVLAPDGTIHMIPYSAAVGQKISSAGVVSTYSLVYTTSGASGAYHGGVLAPDGTIHMIPYSAIVGQKISSAGVVSTYSLVYTASGAYHGGVLAPDGTIHMIPYKAAVGQKISSAGVVSTYSLVYTTSGASGAYHGGVLAPDGTIHMIPYSAIVGQKISSAGVVSTYSLVYTTTGAYHGGVLASDGTIHMIPSATIVGQKINSAGVVSTYSLVYTTSYAFFGGVLAPDGNIYMIPYSAAVGQKICGLSAVPFNKAMCMSSFFNKL